MPPLDEPNFVAITARSRFPRSARPGYSSLVPPFSGFHLHFPRRRNRPAALRVLIEDVRREIRGQGDGEASNRF